MARVTVEDCILMVPNRFDLVMRAAQRARHISAGAEITVDRDNDKNPVVALREIAEVTVDVDGLESSLVRGMQKYVELDEPEEDELDLIAMQQELSGETGEAVPEEEISQDGLSVRSDGTTVPGEEGEMAPVILFEDSADAVTETDAEESAPAAAEAPIVEEDAADPEES